MLREKECSLEDLSTSMWLRCKDLSLTFDRMVFGKAYQDRWIIPASWYAVWQISTNIGLMMGAVLCGWLQDRIGRRWTLFASSMVISVAAAMCYVSDLPTGLEAKRGLFFMAKTVQGFGVGGMMCSTQTWLVWVSLLFGIG